jgi:hypothetical protein
MAEDHPHTGNDHHDDPSSPHGRAQLVQARGPLHGQGYNTALETDPDQLLIYDSTEGTPTLVARCAPRDDDGGTYWFSIDGEFAAPADGKHVHELITAVKERAAAQA